MAETPSTDVQDLSYEEARDELIRLVARIESGEAPLEESMRLWERGEALAAHCQAKLDQAQEALDRSAVPQDVGPTPAEPPGRAARETATGTETEAEAEAG